MSVVTNPRFGRPFTTWIRFRPYYLRAERAFAKARRPADLEAAFRDPDAAEIMLGYTDSGEYTRRLEIVARDTNPFFPARVIGGSKVIRYERQGSVQFPVPRDVMAMVDGNICGLGNTGFPLLANEHVADTEMARFIAAKAAWHDKFPGAFGTILVARWNLSNLLAAVEEADHGRLFFWNTDLVLNAEALVIVFIPFFLGIEAVTFARLRRRRSLGIALA